MKTKKKKTLLWFTVGFLSLIGILIILGFVFFPRPDLPQRVGEDICSQYNITINTESIDKLYSDPQSILSEPMIFKEEDRAYQLMAEHRARVNDPFQMDAWTKKIEKLASLPEEERKQDVTFRLYQLILDNQQSFCQEVVDNVLTYLPEGTDLNITIYLTAHEGSAAAYFHTQEIAFSLSHPLLANTAMINESTGLSAFFNLALHEIFHVGFGENLHDLSTEEHRKNEIIIDLLTVLQNEGIATYISQQLTPDYPSPFEYTTYLIDNETLVRWYIGKLNEILADGSPPPEGDAYNEIYRQIGKIGYRWNGLYIVGGYMAMTIENELGREVLVQTIEDGFYTFAETYNSLVDEDMQIVWELVP